MTGHDKDTGRLRPDGLVPLILLAGPFACPRAGWPDPLPPQWADTLALEGGEAWPDHAPRPGAALDLPDWLDAPSPAARTWLRICAARDGSFTPPVSSTWYGGLTRWVLGCIYVGNTAACRTRIEMEPLAADEWAAWLDGTPVALGSDLDLMAGSAQLDEHVKLDAGFHRLLFKIISHGALPRFRLRLHTPGADRPSLRLWSRPRRGFRGHIVKRGKRRPAAIEEPRTGIFPVTAERVDDISERRWRAVTPLAGFVGEGGWAERWPTAIRGILCAGELLLRIDCTSRWSAEPTTALPWLADHVRLMLDLSHDHRGHVLLLVDAAGRLRALRRQADVLESVDEIELLPRERRDGWAAVIRIPLPAVRVALRSGHVIGFNAIRCCPKSGDGFCVWSPPAEHLAPALSGFHDDLGLLDRTGGRPPWVLASAPELSGHVQMRGADESLPHVQTLGLQDLPGAGLRLSVSLKGTQRTVRPTLQYALDQTTGGTTPPPETVPWRLTLRRSQEQTARRELPPRPAGPFQLRLSMLVPTRTEILPLMRLEGVVPGVTDFAPDALLGGWLMSTPAGPARVARFGIAGEEIFRTTLTDQVRTPWPWLIYARTHASACTAAITWNARPLESPDWAPAEGTGLTLLGVVPPERIHPNQNELQLLTRRGGPGASFELNRLVIVREEQLSSGAGRTEIALPVWRALGEARARATLLPAPDASGELLRQAGIELKRERRLVLPFLLAGSLAVRTERLDVELLLYSRTDAQPPDCTVSVNGVALAAAKAEADAPAAFRRCRLCFSAAHAPLLSGLNRMTVSLAVAAKSLWWLSDVRVIMDVASQP